MPQNRGLYKPLPGPRAKSNHCGGTMKLRFIVSLLAVVTIFGLSANAQELPKIDASVSYSYFRANPATSGFGGFSLNGGSASAAYRFRDWLSAVADFGGYSVGKADGVNVHSNITTYRFGPRVTYRVSQRISPFPHVLVGPARAGSGVFSTATCHTAFAPSLG